MYFGIGSEESVTQIAARIGVKLCGFRPIDQTPSTSIWSNDDLIWFLCFHLMYNISSKRAEPQCLLISSPLVLSSCIDEQQAFIRVCAAIKVTIYFDVPAQEQQKWWSILKQKPDPAVKRMMASFRRALSRRLNQSRCGRRRLAVPDATNAAVKRIIELARLRPNRGTERLRAKGRGPKIEKPRQKRRSLRSITLQINREGLYRPDGKPWNDRDVKKVFEQHRPDWVFGWRRRR
jgi:hypothetical protein